MRIAIVGAGAMGSLYAAYLAKTANEVWAIDRWAEHIDAIRRDGLRVTGVNGDFVGHPQASTAFADVGRFDLVVLATKSADAASAASTALEWLADDGVVLTIQNGVGAADQVAEVVGPARLMLGVAGGFAAKMHRAGHVHHFGWQIVQMGEYLPGASARVERIAALWRAAGFNVETHADLNPEIWRKLLCNVGCNALCALSGMTVGQVLADAHAASILAASVREAYAVAQARGIELGVDDPVHYVLGHASRIPDARPSLAQDHMAQRHSEINELNGAVVELAARAGLAAPVNATLAALIRARETFF